MFPRYLFIELDPATRPWRALRSTFGIIDMVLHGDRPAPVPDGVVEEIRGREDDNGLIVLARLSQFRKGDPVRVVEGPLVDQVGVFDCEIDDDRVVLLLQMLGRGLSVRLPMRAIARAN